MLEKLNLNFSVLAKQIGASPEHIDKVKKVFPLIPPEYLQLASEATELELEHTNGQYIRLWGPIGCIEMYEAHDFSRYITEAIPFGDDGGGRVLLYLTRNEKHGIYHLGFGNLDEQDAIYIAPNVTSLLLDGTGMDTF